MGNTGMGNTGMGNAGMGNAGMGKTLGFASLFTLCAATSALAISTRDVEFAGLVTAEQLVRAFCEIKMTRNGSLKLNGSGSNASRYLSGTGQAGSGRKAWIAVRHKGFHSAGVGAYLTATNPTLTKNGENYVDRAYLYSGFGLFPGFNEGGDFTVNKVDTKVPVKTELKIDEPELFEVWFFAEKYGAYDSEGDDGAVFPPGDYVGTTTITCSPGQVPLGESEVDR